MAKVIKMRQVTAEDKRIASLLRTRRNLAGMTQMELGAKIGVTFQQIQKYEKGVNRISAGKLTKIADALGESVNYFIAGDEVSHEMKEFNKVTSPQVMRLVKAFTKIEENSKRATLVDLAEFLGGVR